MSEIRIKIKCDFKKISESVNSSPSWIPKCLAMRTTDSFTYFVKTARRTVWKMDSDKYVSSFPQIHSRYEAKARNSAPGRTAQLFIFKVGSIPGEVLSFFGCLSIFIISIFWKLSTSRSETTHSSQALSGTGFLILSHWGSRLGPARQRVPQSQDLGREQEGKWLLPRSSFARDMTFCHLTMCMLLCFTQICWSNLSTVIIFSSIWPNGYKFQ